ncbi:MAG: pyrroloquinoline quinone precursor peptide PqqA [Caulobacteraceae bacterium]
MPSSPLEGGADMEACLEERSMTWTTPRVIEIMVGMEINCYAVAEI